MVGEVYFPNLHTRPFEYLHLFKLAYTPFQIYHQIFRARTYHFKYARVFKQHTRSFEFKNDTFQPHHYKHPKTDTITKKVKMDINFKNEKISDVSVLKHIERSVRIDNILKKLLKSPIDIKKEGFDFKGNSELKKAMTVICTELGGEWSDVPNYFK